MKGDKGFFIVQDIIIFLLCTLLLLSTAHNLRQAMELQLTLHELSRGIILANSVEYGEEVKEDNLHVEIISDAQNNSPYKEFRISNNKKILFNLFIAH